MHGRLWSYMVTPVFLWSFIMIYDVWLSLVIEGIVISCNVLKQKSAASQLLAPSDSRIILLEIRNVYKGGASIQSLYSNSFRHFDFNPH